MKRTLARVFRRLRPSAGATLAEYTWIVAIISIAAVVALWGIGQTTNGLLEDAADMFPR